MVRFRPRLTTRDRRDGGIAGFALGQKSRLCNSSEAKSSPSGPTNKKSSLTELFLLVGRRVVNEQASDNAAKRVLQLK